jgi:hypothetical protein
MRRVNFAARIVGDTSLPGVRAIILRVISQVHQQGNPSPETIVQACLDAMGPLEVSEETFAELMVQAEECGQLAWGTIEELGASVRSVSKILTLITASRDYQLA